MAERLFDPLTTALVSIDMQTVVATHAALPHTAAEVVERIVLMLAAARASGALPIFVRTSFLPDESDTLHPLMDIPRPRYPKRMEKWDQLLPEMGVLPTEPVIIKRSFNAFYGSDLDLQLRRHRIETVIMAGISTNFGVEGTARSAYDHGYNVVFASDAMAAGSVEAHEAPLKYVFPVIGRVRTVAEIIESFTA